MTILFITPYIPYPPSFGGSVRIYNLILQLSRWHRILLLTYDDEGGLGTVDGLRDLCDQIQTISHSAAHKRLLQFKSLFSARSCQYHLNYTKTMNSALEAMVRANKVDLIMVEFSQLGCIKMPRDIPVVIDQHNVEHDLIRRMARRSSWSFRKLFNMVEAIKYKREEIKYLQRASLVLATSERDAELMRNLVPSRRCSVVPNGVNVEFFKNPGISPQPNTLVFVGATHYFPNADGIHFYMREIHPLITRRIPDLKVFIVGGNPPPAITEYASEKIQVTGFVEDVRHYIHNAAAFVVPLRMGGGTRFKVVEAMAAGTPVISTSLGSEGIRLTSGKQAMVADTPATFAQAVVEVLTTPGLAANLRTEGYEFVQKYFDWSVIGKQLDEQLEAIADHA